MSRRIPSKEDALFTALASSGALTELITFWSELLSEHTNKLHNLATAALEKYEFIPLAQMQKGRCKLLEELIDHANMYKS